MTEDYAPPEPRPSLGRRIWEGCKTAGVVVLECAGDIIDAVVDVVVDDD